MVNHQHYQSILDEYFSQVAEMTKEFEDVLKEQTELLLSLIHISEPTRLSLVSRMPSSA